MCLSDSNSLSSNLIDERGECSCLVCLTLPNIKPIPRRTNVMQNNKSDLEISSPKTFSNSTEMKLEEMNNFSFLRVVLFKSSLKPSTKDNQIWSKLFSFLTLNTCTKWL